MLNNTKIRSITDTGIRQRKRVCNSTLEASSLTLNGNHIYMEVGCGRDELLLQPFPHLSLEGDSVGEEPNAWKSAIDKTHYYHMGKEEFVDQMPQVHWSTERICTYVTETPQKWGVCLPGFGSGDSRRSENACKHTIKEFKTIISLKIKLLHFSLKITMVRSRRFFKR
jgi:hypothetical protein